MPQAGGGGGGCAWFVVPNSELEKILGVIGLGLAGGAVTGYSARYACGSEASGYRAKGYAAYATQAEAEKTALAGGATAGALGAAGAAAAPANPSTGWASVTDFLSRLTQASTWLRVAEVGIGIVLLAIGIARVTRSVPVATKIAKTAGAVALA